MEGWQNTDKSFEFLKHPLFNLAAVRRRGGNCPCRISRVNVKCFTYHAAYARGGPKYLYFLR